MDTVFHSFSFLVLACSCLVDIFIFLENSRNIGPFFMIEKMSLVKGTIEYNREGEASISTPGKVMVSCIENISYLHHIQ